MMVLAIACSDSRNESPSSASEASGLDQASFGDAARANADATEAGFTWPEKADHPRIELEMAFQGRTGMMEIELFPELAPESVARVLDLVSKAHYDGTTFHRVIPGFMIQGGDPNSRDNDPTNDGRGGDPRPIPDEFSAAPFERGAVALANRGQAGSSSSQFFIMQADGRNLDGQYNLIGRVRTGIEVVDEIVKLPTDEVGRWGPKDRPMEKVEIRRMSTR